MHSCRIELQLRRKKINFFCFYIFETVNDFYINDEKRVRKYQRRYKRRELFFNCPNCLCFQKQYVLYAECKFSSTRKLFKGTVKFYVHVYNSVLENHKTRG